jgi:menaquinone-specific isochorismate synthase
MPNHVHAVCRLFHEETLDRVVHSWKSYTANRANRILGRKGTLWMREYYDRIVRNRWELERTIRYVCDNPVKAGLREWEWVRVYEVE